MTQLWRVVVDCGIAMSLISGGYLLLLLRIWPRVFIKRFPIEIQNAVAPLSPRERVFGFAASVPLLVSLIAFPAWASIRMAANLDAEFSILFWAAFLTWMAFNLFDWLVLDELVIGIGRPSWLVLKGAEQIPLTFNHKEHALAFLNGTIAGVVLSMIIAGVVFTVY